MANQNNQNNNQNRSQNQGSQSGNQQRSGDNMNQPNQPRSDRDTTGGRQDRSFKDVNE